MKDKEFTKLLKGRGDPVGVEINDGKEFVLKFKDGSMLIFAMRVEVNWGRVNWKRPKKHQEEASGCNIYMEVVLLEADGKTEITLMRKLIASS